MICYKLDVALLTLWFNVHSAIFLWGNINLTEFLGMSQIFIDSLRTLNMRQKKKKKENKQQQQQKKPPNLNASEEIRNLLYKMYF